MNGESFPKNLRPPAVDSPNLEPPTLVHRDEVKETVVFPKGGGRTKLLLTEENAGCRFMNMGIFFASPGQGSQWHTHPEEAEEEEYLYVIKGEGTLFYKQGGKDHEIPFKEGEAIFTGHLTHYLKNTGKEDLEVYFSITPLPAKTIIYEVKNDRGLGYVDSPGLKPPQLVKPADIEISYFTKGGLANRRMLHPEVVGARHGRLGTAWEDQGTGSTWHTHPLEIGEEDLFYAISGKGVMVYLQGGKMHGFEFRGGDAIHSHHLTNYTKNPHPEVLQMLYSGAPHPAGTIAHEW